MEIVVIFMVMLTFMGVGFLIYTQSVGYVSTNAFSSRLRYSNAVMRNYIKMIATAQTNVFRKSKQLEGLSRKLNFSNQELERLNQMKSKFLSMVVHDVRNPLAGIKGYSDMLINNLDRIPRERQVEYLRNILSSADHLGLLISDLTDLAMIEAGKLKIEKKPFNYQTMCMEIIAMLSPKAASRGILLMQRGIPKIQISGDKFRLSQVLSNLIGNAVKFTPPKGTIEIYCKEDYAHVFTYVKDSGLGIDPRESKKIFEKFYQAKYQKNESSKKQGWGLGLSISREIISQHGGEIGVSSPGSGKGSIFWFKIPKN